MTFFTNRLNFERLGIIRMMILLRFFGAVKTSQGRWVRQLASLNGPLNSAVRPTSFWMVFAPKNHSFAVVRFVFFASLILSAFSFAFFALMVFFATSAHYFFAVFTLSVFLYALCCFWGVYIFSLVCSIANFAVSLMSVFPAAISVKCRKRFKSFTHTTLFRNSNYNGLIGICQ
jgi:hypothetical protein